MSKYFISNVNIILADSIQFGAVSVDAGKIVGVYLANDELPIIEDNITHIDGMGKYISPGFIDIHIHGGGGSDFMDGTVEAFLNIAETHAKFGTTALLPTTLTTTQEQLELTLSCYEKASAKNLKGATFLGMHLEGPYFSVAQKGAQDERYIRDPKREEYTDIVRRFPFVKRWSIAPELPGALEMGEFLIENKVLPAVAHTDAVFEEVERAHQVGFSLMTHFYSAMSSVKRINGHRVAGTVEAGYLIDDFDVEIIADGVHLPKPFLEFVCKFKKHDKIILITDAMRAAGTSVKESVLGPINEGTRVLIEDGVAKLEDRSAFAGSVATADRLVRVMMNNVDIPLYDIINMISFNPARVLGKEKVKGRIEVGYDADLVIFDENIEVACTIVEGRIVYDKL